MTTFEKYAPFHDKTLSADEQQDIQSGLDNEEMLRQNPVPAEDLRPNGFMVGGRFMLNPILNAHTGIAIQRSQDQLKGWQLPEDPDICNRFPGVDPLGKYCAADMAFAQRESALRAALATRPPEMQSFVGDILNRSNSKNRGDAVFRLRDEMRDECFNIRGVERAAKLCLDPTASAILEDNAKGMATGSAQIKAFDGMLTGLEQLAGLREGEITPEVRQLFENTIQTPIPPEVEAQRGAPGVLPQVLHVEFENFDNQVAQRFFSNPRHWGKTPKDTPQDAVNLDSVSGAVSRYACATADRSLQPIYQKLDDPHGKAQGINRGNLITVDGKTIRELMTQDYQKAEVKEPFDAWYGKNLRVMTNEYVSAGLMAGKRVEAFIPDAQGKLPQEPTQITKAGYQPSPIKKVTLNAWERHFSKHGFYKEKVAKAEEYRRVMDGRERVQAQYQLARTSQVSPLSARNKQQFFGQYEAEHGPISQIRPESRAFRLTRSAPMSTCICAMAAQGHSIEDIIDPSKLQAEKAEMGKLYMDKAMAGDTEWLGKTFFEGQRALVGQVDAMDRSLNLSDPKQMEANLPMVYAATSSIFDVSQENADRSVKAAYFRAAGGVDGGVERGTAVDDAANNLAAHMDCVVKGLAAKVALSDPLQQRGMHHTDITAHLSASIGRNIVADRLADATKAAPQLPLSQRTEMTSMLYPSLLVADPSVVDLSKQLTDHPDALSVMGKMVLSGQLAEKIKGDITTTTCKATSQKPVFTMVADEDGVAQLQENTVRVPSIRYTVQLTANKTLSNDLAKQQQAPKLDAPKPPQMGGGGPHR